MYHLSRERDMKLEETFGYTTSGRITIECHPESKCIIITSQEKDGKQTVIDLEKHYLRRFGGFISLCLEAIRRVEELKEQQDG